MAEDPADDKLQEIKGSNSRPDGWWFALPRSLLGCNEGSVRYDIRRKAEILDTVMN